MTDTNAADPAACHGRFPTASGHPHPGDMPYAVARADDGRFCCDLCGRPAARLARVVLEPGGHRHVDGVSRVRAARVLYVCRAHPAERAQGVPVAPPRKAMLRGTTRLRPQPLALFGDLSLRRGRVAVIEVGPS